MSKRQSTGGSNTLFNYFARSPSVSKNGNENKTDNLENETPKKNGKRQMKERNDEEDIIKPVKRRKQILHDSESDNDSDTNATHSNNPKIKTEKESESDMETEPKKSTLSQYKNSKSEIKKQTKIKQESKDKHSSNENEYTGLQDTQDGITWKHDKLKFLKLEFIKDKFGRKATHPDYDSRTVYVPDDFIVQQTPAMRQWWEMKKDHYDCILFFKVGKFYELYHMDAVVGVNELGFSYMKGEFAHSGFPESAYSKMSSVLIELGYKVARIEQTETPEAMNDRLRAGGGSKTKVVRREICQITTRATRVIGLQDADIRHPLPSYLLAVYEQWSSDKSTVTFGVCFIDCTIGTFYLGQFQDDARYSRLLTLLAEYPPSRILEERKQLSSATKSVMKIVLGDLKMESLTSDTQFYSSTKTLKKLFEDDYFKQSDGKLKIPIVLKILLNEADSLNSTCKPEYELAVRCLGGCMWYLKSSLLDIRLLTMGKFEFYCPSDVSSDNNTAVSKYLMLDSYCLTSLNLLGIVGSLQTTLDYCCTPFGKRMLHQYICRPLASVKQIVTRQQAVTELVKNTELIQTARAILVTLPDLERNVSRIHALGNALHAKKHPDSRAIFYEGRSYSKRKIKDFLATLNGFEKAISFCEIFSDINSDFLKKYTSNKKNGLFPDIVDLIKYFKNSFNHEEAEKEGKIIPEPGMDPEYDSTVTEINEIQAELDAYLQSQSKFFGCKVTYHGTEKKRFQLDIPDAATHKVTRDYLLEGARKGTKASKRYTTNESRKLLARMIAAETRNREMLQDLNRRTFEKFSADNESWSMVCHCLSIMDVMLAFAEYTRNQNVDMCVPEVLPFDSSPKLLITNGIHPYTQNVESFVPNDTVLGENNQAGILILTGPNMGGKSTLMRQVAILVIMAQMGCHVPASSMTLTLVDRIFTRLGAHDDIIAGHSTFLIELRESLAILRHATHNSLVLLDELGRGTSTHDGTAIATTYVDHLLEIQCRTVFSTHYYSLVDFYKSNPCVQLGHMTCRVESEEDDISQESVILMYKMTTGVCPKSFGFNAARLAGIPKFITTRASKVAQIMELQTQSRKLYRALFGGENDLEVEKIREMLDAVLG